MSPYNLNIILNTALNVIFQAYNIIIQGFN